MSESMNMVKAALPASFNVFIAYDKASDAALAMRLVERMTRQMGPEVEVHQNLWRFDILDLAEPNRIACGEALEADLLVVAGSSERNLPTSLKLWLQEWSSRSIPASCGLVALLESNEPGRAGYSPAYFFLEAMAGKAEQAFFFQEVFSEKEPA